MAVQSRSPGNARRERWWISRSRYRSLGIAPSWRQTDRRVIIKPGSRLTGERDPASYQSYEVTTLVLRHIEQVPLGTPYPTLIWKIKDLLANPNVERDCRIAIDATGVGGPFLDFLRQNGVNRNVFPSRSPRARRNRCATTTADGDSPKNR